MDLPKDLQSPLVYLWKDFLKLGKDVKDSVVKERMNKQLPGQCVFLFYTSGTTGNPKGVMVSHDNCTWAIQSSMDHGNTPEELVNFKKGLSFLPLSHIVGYMATILFPLYIGNETHFARPDAMQGTLI